MRKMHKSVLYWLLLTYKRRYEDDIKVATDENIIPPPRNAKDRRRKKKDMKKRRKMSAPRDLQEELERLMKRWEKRWNEAAKRLSEAYVDKTNTYTRNALYEQLKEIGFTVKGADLTPELKAVLESAVIEQASLIRSIPSQYHTEIAGMVQRAFQSGRDVKQLSDELRQRYEVTSRRAYLIARDQMNKATDVISRTRVMNLGITEGIWMHRAAGSKTFRKRHVEFDGERFDLAKGMYDDTKGVERYVHPGELPYCFVEGTKVNASPYIQRITKRYYSGNVQTITLLDGGITLKCTPNHLLFTRNRGWTRAKDITDKMTLVVMWPSVWYSDDDAPTIEQLFDAWRLFKRMHGVFPCTPEMFHGDGQIGVFAESVRNPHVMTECERSLKRVPDAALSAREMKSENILNAFRSSKVSPFAFAKVDSVDIVPFEGYVYNLETVKGWYVANRVLVHNCKCTYLPIIPGVDSD